MRKVVSYVVKTRSRDIMRRDMWVNTLIRVIECACRIDREAMQSQNACDIRGAASNSDGWALGKMRRDLGRKWWDA